MDPWTHVYFDVPNQYTTRRFQELPIILNNFISKKYNNMIYSINFFFFLAQKY